MPSRCSKELKEEVLSLYRTARAEGITQKRFCALLRITPRRVQRWHARQDSLEDGRPGPVPGTAPHRLKAGEKEAVRALACQEEYADMSHRTLAYIAMDSGGITASPSTFYRIMRALKLTSHRGIFSPHTGAGTPPEREELTGPLQRLCWDISFLKTTERGRYFYLYTLLDEWSRKVMGWMVSKRCSREVALEMIDAFCIREHILALPEDKRPVIINDNGSQMKAKDIQQMFEDMGMEQRFSRPHTPNDNPYIESFFRTAKYHPWYPGKFCSVEEASHYFSEFFKWYNRVHLHSGIGFITPEDKHNGRAEEIISKRKEALRNARAARLEAHRKDAKAQEKRTERAVNEEKGELCVA